MAEIVQRSHLEYAHQAYAILAVPPLDIAWRFSRVKADGKLYQRAVLLNDQCVVWLSTENEDTKGAFEMAEIIHKPHLVADDGTEFAIVDTRPTDVAREMAAVVTDTEIYGCGITKNGRYVAWIENVDSPVYQALDWYIQWKASESRAKRFKDLFDKTTAKLTPEQEELLSERILTCEI